MDPLTFGVEVARSTGHPTAADSPITYDTVPGSEFQPGQPFEALRFQVAQATFDSWPVGEFPLNRMTCQLINSFAYTEALSMWTRRNAD